MSAAAGILTPSLIAKASTVVTRVRELPLRGEILVRLGQQVQGSDIVAHAERPGELTVLRLAETLGLLVHEVIKSLQVKVGEDLLVGTLICDHRGLFGLLRSRYVSPVAGKIEFISEESGHIGVRAPPQRIELNAYICGEVTAIEASRRVTIKTSATFVQGIFGVGGERCGELINSQSENVISLEKLPVDLRGKIVFGGTRPTADVLKQAAVRGAVGMIVGAIDDAALQGYLGYQLGLALTGDENVSMTVIVTEGFGELEMGERVRELLVRCQGRMASINGATQVRAGAIRPEIIVSNTEQVARADEPPEQAGVLRVGVQIRFIRGQNFGSSAEVIEMPVHPELLSTGASARVLRAKLRGGQIVTVPRSNVEVLV